MNRKGDIIENLPGVLIAILGLGLIGFGIYQGVLLYKQNFSEQEDNNAIAIADEVAQRVERLEAGKSGSFPVKGLDGWFLAGWGAEDSAKPDKCALGSCICVCKRKDETFSDTPANLCQEKGFCEMIDMKKVRIDSKDYFAVSELGVFREFEGDKIEEEDILREFEGSFYRLGISDFIIMPGNLMELKITKSSDEVFIDYESNLYKRIQDYLTIQS